MTAALSLVILGGVAWGQSQPNISQNTGGECSPAVVSQGKVTITCVGLDSRQQELLRKMPALIDQLLKRNQSDRDELLTKLEEILKLQRNAEARSADRQFTEQQKAKVREFLSGKPKFSLNFASLAANNETTRYATQIASAFGPNGANWPITTQQIGIAMITGAGPGVSICRGESEQGAKVSLVVRDALRAAGMDPPINRLNVSNPDEVTVFVSSKE
jgi:hypothetical protein